MSGEDPLAQYYTNGYGAPPPSAFDTSGMNFWGQPSSSDRVADSQIALNDKMGASYDRQNMPLTGFAKGAQTFGTISQGLSGLASMYLGYQNMKQQKKEFKFNKGVINTNLNNSIMDYNRRLTDTLTNRSLNNGQGSGWVSGELAKYSAKRA